MSVSPRAMIATSVFINRMAIRGADSEIRKVGMSKCSFGLSLSLLLLLRLLLCAVLALSQIQDRSHDLHYRRGSLYRGCTL